MKWVLLALAAGALVLAAGGAAAAAPSASLAAPVTPIRHVVVLYLENHSFDNVFGYWCNGHPAAARAGGCPRRSPCPMARW
jgi:phospholipase C